MTCYQDTLPAHNFVYERGNAQRQVSDFEKRSSGQDQALNSAGMLQVGQLLTNLRVSSSNMLLPFTAQILQLLQDNPESVTGNNTDLIKPLHVCTA